MAGRRKTVAGPLVLLLKRSRWLIFIKLTLVNVGCHFDVHFRNFVLFVIWSLGRNRVVLAALVHLLGRFILLLGSYRVLCYGPPSFSVPVFQKSVG